MKSIQLTYERLDADPDVKKRFIRHLFNGIVPTYDLLNRVLSLGIDQVWRREVTHLFYPLSGKKILDLCCGTGDLSFMLRNKGAKTVSIDFSRRMIQKGIEKNALDDFAAVSDASFLPYQDETFQGATIAFGIRNIPDIHPFLLEVSRVLVPGGRFVILELVRPKNPIIHYLYRCYLNGFLPLVGRLISGDKTAYRYLAKTIATFIDPLELGDLLKANGFDNIRIKPKTLGVAAIISCEKGN